MKKLFLTFAMIGMFTALSYGQSDTSYWSKKGNIGLNFSQSHLSNWAAGGQSSLNSLGLFGYSANYKRADKIWDNSLGLTLGYSLIGDAKAMKTDDKIEFNSVFGLEAIKDKLYYSLAFSFKTQFTDGFDYKTDSTNPISGLFAPAYITLGVGLDWKPNAYFSINFSPLTGRMTIVTIKELYDAGAFGVDKGSTTRFELGAKAMIKFEKEIAKNVTFGSKLELFSDYLKNPQNVDVDWQNLITMKVNNWLNANIAAHLIYDDDIMIMDKDGKTGPRTQFKEILSVGLSYAF
jgi:hypothetical protein